MSLTCTALCYVSDSRGNVRVYKPGDKITNAKFKSLNDRQQSKFKSDGDTVSDAHVLEAVMYHHEAGDTIEGGYKQVWYTLLATMDTLGYEYLAPYCHTRALQIARVGRSYQQLIGANDFGKLCPDLAKTASAWVN